MQTIKPMFNYDAAHDTLYIGIDDRCNSYGDDSVPGVIVLRDISTDTITGVTILRFLRNYRANTLPNLPPNLEESCKEFAKEIIQ